MDDLRLDPINENLKLYQKTNGLTFGTDAYLLASFLPKTAGTFGVELGAGTGVVSLLALTKKKCERIIAAEIQPEYCELMRKNGEINGMGESFRPFCTDIRTLSVREIGGECDFVFANPPYLRAGCGQGNESEPKNIARREICGTVADFCAAAGRLLRTGGTFYTVYRPERLGDLFASLRAATLEPKKLLLVYPDEKTEPCLCLVASRKGGGSGLRVMPPLIIYRDGTRDYTDAFSAIYENCQI